MLYNQPKSARATKEYYQFYIFLLTLTDNEIQVLYKKRMTELKYVTNEERQRIKTEMKIIEWVYNETIDE
jgi:hypothetical protein